MANEEQFNIEHQYQLFLKRLKLSESVMPVQQKVIMKQVYFGAFGQILVLFRDELSELEDDEAVEKLESMFQQVAEFFMNQSSKMN